MRRLFHRSGLMVLALLAAMMVLVAPSFAAPAKAPYNGIFSGTVYGHNNSSAFLTMELDHQGNLVDGTATISEGLEVRGGFCGLAEVPAGTEPVNGSSDPANPRKLRGSTSNEVQGIPVTITVNALMRSDQQTVDATPHIDLPGLCGADPVLNGMLYRH